MIDNEIENIIYIIERSFKEGKITGQKKCDYTIVKSKRKYTAEKEIDVDVNSVSNDALEKGKY